MKGKNRKSCTRQITIDELCDRDCILVHGGTEAETLALEFFIGTRRFPWVVVADDHHGNRQVWKCRNDEELHEALRVHKDHRPTAYFWVRLDFSWVRYRP
jgi:hypothetical protein